MIYSCQEHAEEAIEEALEDEGFSPIFEKIPKEVSTSNRCFICNAPAVYQVIQVSS